MDMFVTRWAWDKSEKKNWPRVDFGDEIWESVRHGDSLDMQGYVSFEFWTTNMILWITMFHTFLEMNGWVWVENFKQVHEM